jgi:hypothetical protein
MSKKCETNVRKVCREAGLSKADAERFIKCACPKPILPDLPSTDEVSMPTLAEGMIERAGKQRYRKERAAEQRQREKEEEKMLKD